MTRLRIFTTTISVALASIVSMACGPYIIQPRDMAVYKIYNWLGGCEDHAERRISASNEAWCELAGIGNNDYFVKVVMSYSPSQIEGASRDSYNPFERWLATHSAAREYLVLAIHCEQTRRFMSNVWWYPATESDLYMTIEDIEDKALSHGPEEMQGRYVLLAVRAMFTQRKWQQCMDYWKSVEKKVSYKFVRDLVEPYLVGCRYHLGNVKGALRDFLRMGDVGSAKMCCRKLNVDLIDYAEVNPELPVFEDFLKDYLLSLDHTLNSESVYYDPIEADSISREIKTKCRRYRDKCLQIAQKKKPSNADLWYYAAAAMSDALGEYALALKCCDAATEASEWNENKDLIAVLKFHVEACSMPMGAEYEAMLQRGMELLARLTAEDLMWFKAELRDNYAEDDYLRTMWYYNDAKYYWHNMLYRIVAGEAAPRLVKAGKTTLALMATNAAENYLAQLLENEDLKRVYDNSTFMLADSLSTTQLREYLHTMYSPEGEFEKWLAPLCYRDKDYWLEQLGTHCLRDMNYDGAVVYLSCVSEDYQRKMNIWPYFKYDPMRHHKVRIDDRVNYKLHYAQDMAEAKRIMLTSKDVNERAHAMMRMSTGLYNAACGDGRPRYFYLDGDAEERDVEVEGRDWALLRYSTGWLTPLSNSVYESLRTQVALSRHLKDEASVAFTNKDIAAAWCVEWCEYLTVMKHYGDSMVAHMVRGCCDRLRDYR